MAWIGRTRMRMMGRSTRMPLAVFTLFLLSIMPSPLGAGTATSSVAASVSAPTVTPLRAYRDGLLAPSRIATDSAGRVYISDYALGQVTVRDEFGRLVSVKKGLDHPLGIAVDSAGLIYVGEDGTGSVSMFLPNWSFVGALGRGAGEFQMPNHITIPSNASFSGNFPGILSRMVIVSDSRADLIKVYSSSGSLIRQFGGSGNSNGQFDFPTGIFVNTGGELFVADQNNNRIQVFTPEGVFLRSFGRSTFMGLGPFARTQGLTGDSQGRIFVADAFQGTVRVIDAQGNAVSTVAGFGEGPGELRGPTSLAIDRNNRLFVVSPGNTRVEILGLDTFSDPKSLQAIIALTPSTFDRKPKWVNPSGGWSPNLNLLNLVVGLVKVVGESPAMIVPESITANGVAARRYPGKWIGDFDGDGIPELRILIDRKNLVATLPDGKGAVVVKGMLADGQSFEGSVPVYVTPGSGGGGPGAGNASPGDESSQEPQGGPR